MTSSPTGAPLPIGAPPPPSPSQAVPPPAPPGAGRRTRRALLAPFRYTYRRPVRAAGYLALFLLFAVACAAGGVWLWFNHYLRAARAELDRGHNAAAVRHLERCRLVRPDARTVLLMSARVARRSGAGDEAQYFLDRYQEVHGEDDGLVLERLLLRATRGEIEEAGPALLARVAAGGPAADLAREALVAGLIYRFRWAAAGHYLDEWLAAAPDTTAALLLRGKLEEQRLATGPAIENYRRVVDLDPEHDEARFRLAVLLLGNRNGGDALAHLAVLRASLPGHPEVAVMWARALALEGRGAESRAALAVCLLAHPDYPAALTEQGAQALTDGDEPEAERLLAKAVALDPGNVLTRGHYAFVLARTGKRDEAAR